MFKLITVSLKYEYTSSKNNFFSKHLAEIFKLFTIQRIMNSVYFYVILEIVRSQSS